MLHGLTMLADEAGNGHYETFWIVGISRRSGTRWRHDHLFSSSETSKRLLLCRIRCHSPGSSTSERIPIGNLLLVGRSIGVIARELGRCPCSGDTGPGPRPARPIVSRSWTCLPGDCRSERSRTESAPSNYYQSKYLLHERHSSSFWAVTGESLRGHFLKGTLCRPLNN